MTSTQWAPKQKGFTIVELLIVIVVIAILAAITIVAYNGISQRAKNSAIVSAAKSTLDVLNAYVATNDKYPNTTGNACLTSVSGCVVNGTVVNASPTTDTALATIGTVPRSIPMNSGDVYGILYTYGATRTLDGVTQPVIMYYWLYGTGQQCGLPGVVVGWTEGVLSNTGYSAANDRGRTLCYINVPGPAA